MSQRRPPKNVPHSTGDTSFKAWFSLKSYTNLLLIILRFLIYSMPESYISQHKVAVCQKGKTLNIRKLRSGQSKLQGCCGLRLPKHVLYSVLHNRRSVVLLLVDNCSMRSKTKTCLFSKITFLSGKPPVSLEGQVSQSEVSTSVFIRFFLKRLSGG